MGDSKAIPENLRAGAKAVTEGCENVELLGDWFWQEDNSCWVMQCRLTPPVAPDGPIPTSTDWYVLVQGEYPWGSIKFCPAKKEGITQTFPHQLYNGLGKPEVPWRTGDLCLTTSVRVLGRTGLEQEPFDAYNRLAWNFRRANDWLIAASHNDLATCTEPYELPQFPVAIGKGISLVAFQEDAVSFAIWKSENARSGVVDFTRTNESTNVFVVKQFRTFDDAPVYHPRWGSVLSQSQAEQRGVWLMLNECPVASPWQAPRTWGELRRIAKNRCVDVDSFVMRAASHLRSKPNLLLIGFPIPKLVGGEDEQIHWIALELPFQSAGNYKGFRNTAEGRRRRDKLLLRADPNPIQWQVTQNWTPDAIQARGRLPHSITSRKVILIGGGALGSVLAEQLVRAGINNLTIIDEETFQAGNLTRHTLLLSDVMQTKAGCLAARLNLLSPYATVKGVCSAFPNLTKETLAEVQEADVVIDCTADDEVLHALGTFPWPIKKQFFSLSLGLHARRLFCFAAHSRRFPAATFNRLIAPWLLKEKEEYIGYELPREGLGCWHPVFPARADDMGLLASVAVKYLERVLLSANTQVQHLTIYEQSSDAFGLAEVRRIVEAAE